MFQVTQTHFFLLKCKKINQMLTKTAEIEVEKRKQRRI